MSYTSGNSPVPVLWVLLYLLPAMCGDVNSWPPQSACSAGLLSGIFPSLYHSSPTNLPQIFIPRTQDGNQGTISAGRATACMRPGPAMRVVATQGNAWLLVTGRCVLGQSVSRRTRGRDAGGGILCMTKDFRAAREGNSWNSRTTTTEHDWQGLGTDRPRPASPVGRPHLDASRRRVKLPCGRASD
jgi:hypothetical protein